MIVLKAQTFTTGEHDVAKFVNINKIKREDIVAITEVVTNDLTVRTTLFFYNDSETKEIMRGFFGW